MVCRQMGYEAGGITAARGVYGKGTGLVWLSDINCAGDEISLLECQHSGFGQNDCYHTEDAGVMCNPY